MYICTDESPSYLSCVKKDLNIQCIRVMSNSRGGLTARDEFLPPHNDVNSPMAAHLNTLLIQHFLISIVRNTVHSWISTKLTWFIKITSFKLKNTKNTNFTRAERGPLTPGLDKSHWPSRVVDRSKSEMIWWCSSQASSPAWIIMTLIPRLDTWLHWVMTPKPVHWAQPISGLQTVPRTNEVRSYQQCGQWGISTFWRKPEVPITPKSLTHCSWHNEPFPLPKGPNWVNNNWPSESGWLCPQ